MALNLKKPFLVFTFMSLISSFFISHTSSSSSELLTTTQGFSPALGTWYGDPRGAGSGGACGWGNDVQSPPFSSMISAGNARIFMHGKGCGDCYQIKCNRKPYCSGNPITVTITDECPGRCNDVPFHFDLSGTAFGAMASNGKADNLRNLGQVDIQYQRVPCNYGRTKIAFKIDAKSNPNWFATAIEFVDGVGEVRNVVMVSFRSKQILTMRNIWGAVWQADINPNFDGPFSFRLTSPTSKVLIANNVVPLNFVPGHTYYSNVNF